MNAKPHVFAMMANDSNMVHVVHSFGQMMLEEEAHPCDGLFGGFLGDRSVMDFDGDCVIQDPEFVTFKDLDELRWSTKVRPASDTTIKNMLPNTPFVKLSTKSQEAEIPVILPLPLSWVPYFVAKPRTNRDAYLYVAKFRNSFGVVGQGNVDWYNIALAWFRTACSAHPTQGSGSVINITTRSVPRDEQTGRWTLRHLQTVVPRLPRAPTPTPDTTPCRCIRRLRPPMGTQRRCITGSWRCRKMCWPCRLPIGIRNEQAKQRKRCRRRKCVAYWVGAASAGMNAICSPHLGGSKETTRPGIPGGGAYRFL